MYRIRRVDGTDLELVNALQKQCLPDDTRCKVTEGRWWLAYDGDKPIAFAGWQEWEGDAYLCRCGVLPAYRGLGLQKKLIRARCVDAARRGCWNAITDTRQNPASANNLIACGFKMYEPRSPWSFENACYWKKKLRG